MEIIIIKDSGYEGFEVRPSLQERNTDPVEILEREGMFCKNLAGHIKSGKINFRVKNLTLTLFGETYIFKKYGLHMQPCCFPISLYGASMIKRYMRRPKTVIHVRPRFEGYGSCRILFENSSVRAEI